MCDTCTFSDQYELTKENVNEAKNKNDDITDVIIENLTKIGDEAFDWFSGLLTVSISSSVESQVE